MYVSNANYYIKEKLKIKVAKWGTPKKIFKKENKRFLDTYGAPQ
jgi:hypothetical protein